MTVVNHDATDRRQIAGAAPTEHNLHNDVRKAVALRRRVGVIAAVEYLKTVGAERDLIERVLVDGAVRAGDSDPDQAPHAASKVRRWTLRAMASTPQPRAAG